MEARKRRSQRKCLPKLPSKLQYLGRWCSVFSSDAIALIARIFIRHRTPYLNPLKVLVVQESLQPWATMFFQDSTLVSFSRLQIWITFCTGRRLYR